MTFFNKLEEEYMYQCRLCKHVSKGKKDTNLTSHLKSCHTEIFEEEVKIEGKEIDVQMKTERLKLLQICVEIVTVNHQPFADLYKSGIQKLIQTRLEKFKKKYPLNLECKNLIPVKDHLKCTAEKIRKKIADDIKNRLVSMSTDIVSKNNRSILGIYVHYINVGNLVTRCIGMSELHQKHTGRYLSSVVTDCLKVYDTQMNQIISLTTDNGANMGTLLKNMNEVVVVDYDTDDVNDDVNNNGAMQVDETEIEADNEEVDYEMQTLYDAEIVNILNEISKDDQIEINDLGEMLVPSDDYDWMIHDMSKEADLATSLTSIDYANFVFVNGINCSAHTLQLSVKDALAALNTEHSNVTSLSKEVAKFFRRQNTIYEMQNIGIKKKLPCLNVDTRWSSTYMMVRKILL